MVPTADTSTARKSVSADALVDLEQIVKAVVANSAVSAAGIALVEISSAVVDHLVLLSALELGSLSRHNGDGALGLAPLQLVSVQARINVRDALLVSDHSVLQSLLKSQNLHRLVLNRCDLHGKSLNLSFDIGNTGLKLGHPDLSLGVLRFEVIELGGKV